MRTNAVILVVDDEESIRYSLKRRLSRDGHEVHVASSGEQGLEQLERTVPDLVLTDMRMPRMDGLAFIAEARSHPGPALIEFQIAQEGGDGTCLTQIGSVMAATRPASSRGHGLRA